MVDYKISIPLLIKFQIKIDIFLKDNFICIDINYQNQKN